MKMKVLLNDSKKYLVKKPSNDFHCKEGLIKAEELQKEQVTTNTGVVFSCFDATFRDLYEHLKRTAQIILPKEIAAVIAHTGIGKESVVADAGAGSGGMSLFLAHVCKHVHSFDVKDAHIETVKKNIDLLDIDNVTLTKHDVTEGFPVEDLDLVVLDLLDINAAVDSAIPALKRGGFLVCYSPHITQVQQTLLHTTDKKELVHVSSFETIEREWVIDEKRARPSYNVLGHTGFISIFRRV